MPYTDFSLESFHSKFGLMLRSAELFPETAPLAAPDWLTATLALQEF
ncbi:MAG: hypothetical protein OHK0022_51210 [Roseiflexaceae bacterium]